MSTTETLATTWQQLAECLRAELADYGGLLALFEEQQKFLFARDANEVLRLSTAIEQCMHAVQASRRHREAVVTAFALGHAQSGTATLRSLLPQVDAVARPLLEALIAEVNHLVHRVRRTSRQNHLFLARTVILHQEVLQQVLPNSFTKTYSPAGRVSMATPHPSSTLRVAG